MRFKAVILILSLILATVMIRVLYLATWDRGFLLNKGLAQANHPRVIPASRGVIFDRNGLPLAISAPIDTVIFDAAILSHSPSDWKKLASNPNLGLSYASIKGLIEANPKSRYVIAKKNLSPDRANSVDDMNIPGVHVQRDQQSFFPEGSAASQLVGFTDVQDNGQSGLELSYNHILRATFGRQLVTESAIGQTYSINRLIKEASDGKDITLSIDARLQYIAYQALSTKVQATHAEWGGAVILNPHTGEVLAAVSYPSYNPNSTSTRSGLNVKDRAITDQFEPGSTMKTVTISEALASGQYTPKTLVETNPGFYYLNGNPAWKIRDDSNNGLLDVTGVITRSSNVGVSKIGLSLPKKDLYQLFLNFGLGQKPSGGLYPGEASGFVYPLKALGDFQFATMMYGYSISASLMQMARLYAAIANEGQILPISYLKLDHSPSNGNTVIDSHIAQEVIAMLKTVVKPGGTGILANVPGYQVAGKTGTAHRVNPQGGYFSDRYNAFFIGLVPADNPQLVIAVAISDPQGYVNSFGGVSAAPVFAKIALAAMHILGITPSTNEIDLKVYRQTEQQIIKQVMEA